jgi:uncharacterized protein (TIRG00374 family)
LLILVDLLSGAARIHIFIRKLIKQNSFWACFKANLANIFLAAATPFQTGGGVAQLYILNKNGIPYSAGVTVSVLNFVATLSLLLLAGTFIVTTVPNKFASNQTLFAVMDISRFVFYFTFIAFTFFVIQPAILSKFLDKFFNWIMKIFPSRKKRLTNISRQVTHFITQYRNYLSYYLKEGKLILLWNYILTIILYFNKCLVAYVVFLGLGISVNIWDVILMQMLIIFFLYFAPTPGAGFVAETSTSAIMSLIAPNHILVLFTVLWRFFTTYFGVFLGSFILLKAIGEPLSQIDVTVEAEVKPMVEEMEILSK